MKKSLLSICMILLMLSSAAAHAAIISTFDIDNENWTVAGLANLSHQSSGGDPGGFLVVDEAGGDTFVVVAPIKFLGDLSVYEGDTLSFDSVLLSASSQTFGSGFGRVSILGGGFSASLDLAPDPPQTGWVTYSAPLVAATWGVSEAAWDQILADVTEIYVILESVVGWETMGFDNFQVGSVPEPATALLLLGGFTALIGFGRKKIIK